MNTFTASKVRFPKSEIPWHDLTALRALIAGSYVSDYHIRQSSPILRPMIRAVAKLPTTEERCAYLEGYAAASPLGQSIVKAILRHGPIKPRYTSPYCKVS